MNQSELEHTLKAVIRTDGRSQASLARKIGVAPDTFNKWVRGVNRIPDHAILAICEQLNLGNDMRRKLMKLAGYATPLPPAAPLQFATHIAPDGTAVNPTRTVSADVTDIYAVFSPRFPLTGTRVSVPDPNPAAYYAFLNIAQDSTLRKLGWRWYHNGEVVNQFEMDVKPGDTVWLQYFRYELGGVFGREGFSTGQYQIVILLGGNPSISAELFVNA